MTKEQIQVYTKRITQANTAELAVVLYDMILASIESGMEQAQNGNQAQFEKDILQAQSFLRELMAMSKMETQVGYDLMALYLFIDRQLLMSVVKRQPVHLEECTRWLTKLRESFRILARQDAEPPLMEHVQQVYAGLTYGRGYLNESVDLTENPNRGFKV